MIVFSRHNPFQRKGCSGFGRNFVNEPVHKRQGVDKNHACDLQMLEKTIITNYLVVDFLVGREKWLEI